MFIKTNKLNNNAICPKRATEGSAGADIYACLDNDISLVPGQRVLVPTGLAFEIPIGYGGFVFARSGTASKFGITLSNCVGVIDSDFRGEVKIAVVNLGNTEYTIRNGDRIAQLVIMPIDLSEFVETDTLSSTDRNDGGFGSTGK